MTEKKITLLQSSLLIKSNVLLKAGPTLKLCEAAQGLVQAGFEDLEVPRFHTVPGSSVLVLSYSLLFCSLLLEAFPAEKIVIILCLLKCQFVELRACGIQNGEQHGPSIFPFSPSYRVDGPWHIFSLTSLLFSMSGTDGLRVSLFFYPECVSQTVKPSINVNLDGDL